MNIELNDELKDSTKENNDDSQSVYYDILKLFMKEILDGKYNELFLKQIKRTIQQISRSDTNTKAAVFIRSSARSGNSKG